MEFFDKKSSPNYGRLLISPNSSVIAKLVSIKRLISDQCILKK